MLLSVGGMVSSMAGAAIAQPTALQLVQQGQREQAAGRLPAAIQVWLQAQRAYQQAQDREGERRVLAHLGAAYLQVGHYQSAIATLEALVSLTQVLQDQPGEARAVGNLALAHQNLGHYAQAIQLHRRAGKLLYALGDRQALGQVLTNLGNALEAVGDYDAAVTAYQQSLKLAQALGDRPGVSIAQNNLGAIAAAQGDEAAAIAHFQRSLAASQARHDAAGQASSWINLGAVYQAKNDPQRATQAYQKALALAQTSGDRRQEGAALGGLGSLAEDRHDYPQALIYHRQNVMLARSLADPTLHGQALNNLGHALLGAGQVAEAETVLRQALRLLDGVRPGLSDVYKVSIFDTQVQTYNLLLQVLVAAQHPEAALEVAEQGRARVFAERLAQRVRSAPAETSPDAPPTMAQIRQIARSQQATLVEYALVPDEAFKFRGKLRGRAAELLIWVVQPTGTVTLRRVDLKPLWARSLDLDQLVTASRCLTETFACEALAQSVSRGGVGVVSAPEPSPTRPPSLFDPKAAHQQGTPVPNSTSTTGAPALRELHRLLIQPIADLLPTDPTARVVLIPQETLFLLPFPALQAADGADLIEQHTVLTAPSIQVLGLTQQRQQAIAARSLASRPLVVGNPTMPTVVLEPGQPPTQLAPLPGAEQEARQVAELLQTKAWLQAQATKPQIIAELPQATLIHLATHGLLEYGTGNRWTSTTGLGVPGAIALAPSAEDSGLLTASEVVDLRLNASLVVLSACDTGQGRITGDGVIGLSRAFMAAGVPSVVVSLWAVPDAPTAQLMVQFYTALQQGQDKAQALRQAMLMTRKAYPNPLNWAAFTLMGAAQ